MSEEVEVVGYLLDKGRTLSIWPAGSNDQPLMTVAKHKRIVAALKEENEILRLGMKGDYDLDAWIAWVALTKDMEPVASIHWTKPSGDWVLTMMCEPTIGSNVEMPLYAHPQPAEQQDEYQRTDYELGYADGVQSNTAEQHGGISVDALAQIIREVDGSNSLGAGALAEKILERVNGRR